MSVRESSEIARASAAERFARWPGLLRLALDVLLGPVVALANQQAIYAGDIWACGHSAHAALHVIPVLCLIVVTGAGVDSYVVWRSIGGVEDERGTVDTRTRFLAILGLSISGVSILVIAAQWFSIFMFGACMRA